MTVSHYAYSYSLLMYYTSTHCSIRQQSQIMLTVTHYCSVIWQFSHYTYPVTWLITYTTTLQYTHCYIAQIIYILLHNNFVMGVKKKETEDDKHEWEYQCWTPHTSPFRLVVTFNLGLLLSRNCLSAMGSTDAGKVCTQQIPLPLTSTTQPSLSQPQSAISDTVCAPFVPCIKDMVCTPFVPCIKDMVCTPFVPHIKDSVYIFCALYQRQGVYTFCAPYQTQCVHLLCPISDMVRAPFVPHIKDTVCAPFVPPIKDTVCAPFVPPIRHSVCTFCAPYQTQCVHLLCPVSKTQHVQPLCPKILLLMKLKLEIINMFEKVSSFNASVCVCVCDSV